MTSSSLIKAIQAAAGCAADGLWGPRTLAAVASKLGCKETVSDVQKAVGTTVDGIIGPHTIAALYAKLCPAAASTTPAKGSWSVFIDPGHTRDYEREHPSQFSGVDWKSGKALEIAGILGIARETNDSVEHALNCKLAAALNEELRKRGKFETMLYDNPSLSNSAEISQVYKRSNAYKPDVFISIHNNAQGGSSWKSMGGTASGTVGLYNTRGSSNKRLAKAVTDCVNVYRRATGGPNNRASTLNTSGVGVLSHAEVPACLIEVCFYDNVNDLYWTCKNIKGIAAAMADGITKFLEDK